MIGKQKPPKALKEDDIDGAPLEEDIDGEDIDGEDIDGDALDGEATHGEFSSA